MKVVQIPNFALNALCQLDSTRYPHLLESTTHNQNNRYSILFAHPQKTIQLNDLDEFDFLKTLESATKTKTNDSDLPFSGGFFVYLGFELVGQIEPVLRPYLAKSDLPIAIAVQIPTAIIFDNKTQKTYLLDQFADDDRIDKTLEDIKKIPDMPDLNTSICGKLNVENPTKFISGVEEILNYIKDGDIFQANLSRRWQLDLDDKISPVAIYQALKNTNPAPFSALAQFDDFCLISSSPERLFKVDERIIETRPIAGTHPRGQGRADIHLKNALINHPKEQAEHLMLLDLERNDLGKVCKYGSVFVDEMMTLESYQFVHHIISNIKGKLRPDATIRHIIQALFPGGTITGCPKIRAIEIITKLEQMPRDAYTGSLGYISANRKTDFNILIRTAILKDQTLTFKAGAGIVSDSIATKELAETEHKATGILKIIE